MARARDAGARSRGWAGLRRLAVAAGACLVGVAPVHAQTIREDFAITNGTVNAQILSGNTLYVGGSFTRVGPVTGAGIPIDAGTGVAISGYPRVVGDVLAAIPDGSGGWFIGGTFTTVGGLPRAGLARILADNSVSAWDPGANGAVRCLALSGTTLYAGGDFTNAGGQSRNRIATIDVASGTALGWDPDANGTVRVLAVSGGSVLAGGIFTTIGGSARNRIAELDAGTGLATSWNPNANSTVLAIVPSGSTVYVGGQFTTIGGQPRNRIAAIDAGTGLATGWNPGANGSVVAVVDHGSSVFVGGTFTTIGGQSRNRVAALDQSTGLATTWNPNANGNVAVLAVSGSDLYVGGEFTSIGGQLRSRVATLATSSGLATAWDPGAYGPVSAMAVASGTVFVGGSFNGMGGTARSNLVALDVTTGAATSWAPDPNDQVLALALGGGAVLAGGNFTNVGGQARANLAAIDAATGGATAWNPAVNGEVASLAVSGTTVYVGGTFTSAGGQARTNLAAVDITSGLASPWNPNSNGQVLALEPGDGSVYVGGIFTNVGGQVRNSLAAIDATTGLATSWNPNPNGTVRALRLSCTTLYVGGFFTLIGGQNRNRLATFDVVTGTAGSWNPNANGPIFALELSGSRMYVGGAFNLIGGLGRDRLAAVDPVTGTVTAWNPGAGGTVRTLVGGGGATVYAGGAFPSVGTLQLSNLGAIEADAICSTVTVSPSAIPSGVVGAAYAQTLSSAGGIAPYCYAVTAGALPAGLTLDAATGEIAGTPSAPGTSVFTIAATDANGCGGNRGYVLSIFPTPPGSTVAANTTGLCISPAHPCVSIPVEYTRTESTPARAISVTLQIDAAKLGLCAPGPPAANFQPGTWLAGFANTTFQVVDNGGGSYTVDQTILGLPCGEPDGGELFRVQLKSVGSDGNGTITVTAVTARDCDGAAIPVAAGPVAGITIFNSPIPVTPVSLPNGVSGSPYSETLTAGAGTPPFAWAVTAGALPPGLTLSSAGALTGTPTSTGTFEFTVGVTDVCDAVGSRAYSVTVECAPIAIQPLNLPDGVLNVAYSQTLVTNLGLAPFTWTISSGALPAGLTLGSGTGEISGTPTTVETAVFTVTVTDASGCTADRGYVVSVFPSAPGSTVSANTAGLCISLAHPCASVPVMYTRTESTPARAISVTLQIDVTKLGLCTPGTPAASFEPGSWLSGFANTLFQVVDNGGGSYTVDQTILGSPCGQPNGGELFRIDLQSVGSDGNGTITVTAVAARDCDGAAIPVIQGPQASISVQSGAPTPVTDLASTQVTSGNPTGATTGITVSWSSGGAGLVSLYRAPFGVYPEYDDPGPVSPPDPGLAPGAPWTLVATSATSGFVDHPPTRGFWHYVALVQDECGNLAPVSNMTGGALNYHLGDVSDGATAGQGDNHVATEDISLLGSNYGIGEPEITNRGVAYLDVGPTTDSLVTSRPTTDNVIDFEDLMMFANNFYVVSAPPLVTAAATEAGAELAGSGGAEEISVVAPSLVSAGEVVTATVRATGSGAMQGFAVTLEWDGTVVVAEGMESGGWVESQGGVVLTPGAGRVDAALLGARAVGMAGDGVVARVRFRAVRAGGSGIRVREVKARDRRNQPVGSVELKAELERPARTVLLAPSPNPMRSVEGAELAFAVAQGGPVELSIYGVDGRRVRGLVSEWREAGVYRVRWDGRDEGGRGSASGVYYVRLVAGGQRFTSKLIQVR